MKNRFLTIVIFVITTCNFIHADLSIASTSQAKSNEFEQLMEKIRQDFAYNTTSDNIEEELNT